MFTGKALLLIPEKLKITRPGHHLRPPEFNVYKAIYKAASTRAASA